MKLSTGAEADIILLENEIFKIRKPKTYRHPQIDMLIRSARTKREANILLKLASLGIKTPKLLSVDSKSKTIKMEYIKGDLVRDYLSKKNFKSICEKIGKTIAIMHHNEIVHGDLTTSNMIIKDNELYLIDFGLSYQSAKSEDFAVDLHLLRQALESKHSDIYEKCFEMIKKSYMEKSKQKDVLARLEIVELRGRNKKKM